MDKIFIQNLHTIGILGVHPHEQVTPREILVSVNLFTDIRQSAAQDEILETISYSSVATTIRQFIEGHAFLTIEALIEALAQELLANPLVKKVWLRVEKPNAVPEAEAVGVEITRSRLA